MGERYHGTDGFTSHIQDSILKANQIPYLKANQMMLAQGHICGKGLGKNSQGPTSPILVTPKQDRKGLDFH